MKKFLAAASIALASLAFTGGVAFAVPSVQQIESAMSQGDWQRADSGLTEVIQAHPDNARAHYLYAQVLNREGRYADALTQVQQAKTLDPQIRFTQPQRFAQVEAKIRSDATRVGAVTTSSAGNPFAQQQVAAPAPAPQKHGPGMGMWIGIAIVLVGVALVLRWTLRRAKSTEDAKAGDDRLDQLKRATELLNGVRSLKLDVKLSTAPGHEALEKEVEGLETQLRTLVETLSNSANPRPPYEIEDLERQFASLKARAEGRPDPNAQPAAPAAAPGYGSDSSYAREADAAFGRQPQYPPQYPPQQQPQVIVQQGGGGMGGMGGLLTGVLLGEALNHGRDRVIERDVIVDDEGRRVQRDGNGNGGGLDFGQGSNDWGDGSGGGGGVDMGSNDSSDDWNNS
ncbi:Tetratricopeptide repeat protein [Paraburkholderia unamae]|uniref:tetratricopeptide repeat protein n=1 Tax=Paraburkholderia unamae TaxID=219649 RepID=UPI001CB350F0|nr:tetratricopeptide repeat protein [Paraburkholderia unamae]CAG9261206.1 Tetratricopeptide repeat protein [Paraburkholderia unamae]